MTNVTYIVSLTLGLPVLPTNNLTNLKSVRANVTSDLLAGV
jgi:hypothetical protein